MISIKQVRELGAPLKLHEWEIVIPNPPLPVLPYVGALSWRARSALIPGVATDRFRSRWGWFTFNHPGRKVYTNDILVRYEEGPEKPIVPALYLWTNMVFNETSLLEPAVAVGAALSERLLTADIYMRMLKPDGKALYVYHLYQAFPWQVVDVTADYGTDDAVMIDVRFSYDYWRLELQPF